MNRFSSTALLSLGLCLALSACGLKELRKQAMTAAGAASIEGTVVSDHEGTVRVLLSEIQEDGPTLVNLADLESPDFEFYMLPGTYLVSAYVDQNDNNRYDVSEPAAVHGQDGVPDPIEVADAARIELPELHISGPLDSPNVLGDEELALSAVHLGTVTSLDESRFSRASASLGMWRPMDYISTMGGGLFFLEPYDPERIPVVFVHGINGTALDFEAALDALDRERFQPWVLQYPSGMHLDIISTYLMRSLNTLHARHAFSRVVIVAHSMGGLVTRSSVMKYAENDRPWDLALVVTVNSPLLGLPSAATGVNHSPIVVASWRDLAPESEFLADLNGTPWPVEIPYRLVFSFEAGKGNDGVVPLERQLSQQLQAEALSIHGFENSHVGTLSDPDFLRLLESWLDQATGEPKGG